jgi:threonine/homoserine/homoserine lactone efflux protein
MRGGMARGFRAQIGANAMFLVLVTALALGLALVAPSGVALRVIKVVGGLFLLWLGIEGIRSVREGFGNAEERRGLPSMARGVLAVVLNPGVWIFLGTAASSLISTATMNGGTGSALLAGVTLAVGLAIGDIAVVLLGGIGLRRVGDRTVVWIRRALSLFLVALGVWLIAGGALNQ